MERDERRVPSEMPPEDAGIAREDYDIAPPDEVQPETQGADPLEAELGEDGQGDIAPQDV